MAWPRFHSERAEPQGAKQMAAPAEPRTPNMHRAKRIAPRECGWKHGDNGHSAGETNFVQPSQRRIYLTPTGLLMEGHYTQNPHYHRIAATWEKILHPTGPPPALYSRFRVLHGRLE